MTTQIHTAASVDHHALGEAYAVALDRYLTYPDATTLRRAYELGRNALNDELGPADLVLMHEEGVEHASITRGSSDRQVRTRATAFLMEALSPFEMIHRTQDPGASTHGINEALENESRRTARQIHDGAGQILFSLQLALMELKVSAPEQAGGHLQMALQLAEHLDQQLRSLSRDLYPVALDDLGINAAVRHLLHGVSTRTQMTVSYRSSVPDRLPPAVAACLYRAIHEAVTNVVRHAKATEIEVSLEHIDQHIVCAVRDNGRGLADRSAPSTGLGLLGIRERVKDLDGDMEFTSGQSCGTQLAISIPFRFGGAAQWASKS